METDYFSFIQDNDPAVLSLEEIKACLEELETEKVGNIKNVKNKLVFCSLSSLLILCMYCRLYNLQI